MSKLIKFIMFFFLAVVAFSCVSSDDDFIDGGGFYNDGQVSFEGVTLPLTYADFHQTTTVQGGQIWTLVLSEEFLGQTNTHSDAYLYLEVFRPNGSSLDGVYDMLHPVKFIDYAAYYEDVMLYNGAPNGYGFHIPNNSFNDGRVRVEFVTDNIYYFEVRLQTYTGEILTAWFEGRLNY